MVEKSFYWDGTTVGDALVLAPYSVNEFHGIWNKQFSRANNQGVFQDILNELEVTTIGTTSVSVSTGHALVVGWFYESDASEAVPIPTPVTNPRIDRIVVRKSQATQTVRITRVAGTEAASPSPPALSQDEALNWDIPLAQARIETTGVITVTDEREFIISPLVPYGNKILIERIEAGAGDIFDFTFDNITQIYQHLLITGLVRHTNSDVITFVETITAQLNDDSSTNYNFQLLRGRDAADAAAAVISQSDAVVGVVPNSGSQVGLAGNFSVFIPNYTDTNLYKTISAEMLYWLINADPSGALHQLLMATTIWEDVSAIEKIEIRARSLVSSEAFPFAEGSAISLYGLR